MRRASLFYADDKDIFDLVMSNRKKLSDEHLRAVLRERGIIVSPETPREKLAMYLSTLPTGWQDLHALRERVGYTHHRASRNSTEVVSASLDELEQAVRSVQQERTERRDERYQIARTASGLEIHVEYVEHNWGKSRLRQEIDAEATIVVEESPAGGAVSIRFPDDDRGREIKDAIILRALGDPEELTRDTISLEGCDAEQRTQFFITLTASVEGFSLRTVSRVLVRRLDDETSDDEYEGESQTFSIDAEGGPRIQRAQFDGASVLTSPEFIRFRQQGFYIRSAVWRARQDGDEGLDAEFDAGFSSDEHGTTFSYRLRGVFRRDEQGQHQLTRRAATTSEQATFLRALERAANAARDEVRASAGLASEVDALDSSVEAEDDEYEEGDDSVQDEEPEYDDFGVPP